MRNSIRQFVIPHVPLLLFEYAHNSVYTNHIRFEWAQSLAITTNKTKIRTSAGHVFNQTKNAWTMLSHFNAYGYNKQTAKKKYENTKILYTVYIHWNRISYGLFCVAFQSPAHICPLPLFCWVYFFFLQRASCFSYFCFCCEWLWPNVDVFVCLSVRMPKFALVHVRIYVYKCV